MSDTAPQGEETVTVSESVTEPIVGFGGSDPSGGVPHDESTGYPGSDAAQAQFADREAALNPTDTSAGDVQSPEPGGTADAPVEPATTEVPDVPGDVPSDAPIPPTSDVPPVS